MGGVSPVLPNGSSGSGHRRPDHHVDRLWQGQGGVCGEVGPRNKITHLQSGRLASLGMMGDQIRHPLNPSI